MTRFTRLAALAAALFAAVGVAPAQNDRRDRQDPELVLEPGGRTAACDQLLFVKDAKGQELLLAAGDDKAVRVWKLDAGKLIPGEPAALRWPVWREYRGAIYALAVSPDASRCLVGGMGLNNSAVALLDREKGQVISYQIALPEPGETYPVIYAGEKGKPVRLVTTPNFDKKRNPGGGENLNTVWSAAFSPSGKKAAFGTTDGSVFVWDLTLGPDVGRPYRRVGKVQSFDPSQNMIRLLRFENENSLLAVAEGGGLLARFDLRPGAKVPADWVWAQADTPDDRSLAHRAAVSPDGQWLAVGYKHPFVAVRRLADAGKKDRDIKLEPRQFPIRLAFSPDSRFLAVAVGRVHKDARFYVEADYLIRVYDLAGDMKQPDRELAHPFRCDGLAFSGDGRWLAVSGGESNEVRLWDWKAAKGPAAVVRGAGACLWAVGLSADGRLLGFKDRRDPDSIDPNRLGRGPWHVFDLQNRHKRVPDGQFTPVEQLTELDGWTIDPKNAEGFADPYVWYAVHKDLGRLKLPIDRRLQGMPRCYAFIRPTGEDRNVRVAVGHYWGLSVFELTDKAGKPRSDPDPKEKGARLAKRVRLYAGQQGEVMALAVSKDRTWIVSAGLDQTIAAWSLKDQWPSEPQLGASFAANADGSRLLVKKVDAGSPAWEAGLMEDDLVKDFGVFPNKIFTRDGDKVLGKAEDALARLRDPVAGVEHYFKVERTVGRETVEVELSTTVRQRPLWRFFPTRSDSARPHEWVLWMWRTPFYDTSTEGDSFLLWHVNGPKVTDTPRLFRAEQLREQFQNRDAIDKLLSTRDVTEALKVALDTDNPQPLRFDLFEPPPLKMEVTRTSQDGDQLVKLQVLPRGDNPDYLPRVAELWVNDYRAHAWGEKDLSAWMKQEGRAPPVYSWEVAVPAKVLRSGNNVLVFQVYNRLGGRAERSTADDNVRVFCPRLAPDQPRLLGLMVGINDYQPSRDALKAGGGRGVVLRNLDFAVGDAEGLGGAWEKQALYKGADVVLRLDGRASREQILAALDDLGRNAGPDDRVVIFLAGHGFFPDKATAANLSQGPTGKGVRGVEGYNGPPADQWVFCCPNFHLGADPALMRRALTQTGITSFALYEKLAAIKARKLVLIDACHSGEAINNPVRGLTPGRLGPAILSACDSNQEAFENKSYKHGLFTYALLEALGDKMADADTDKTGRLNTTKLYAYTQKRLRELLKEPPVSKDPDLQVPQLFLPDGQDFDVARLARR
jgi:WD40 repeat protein